jgi:hypothetical protein
MVNALDYFSEQAYNEAVDAEREETMGDGYRNESQRLFAHSSNTIPYRDESAKIDALAAAGKFVVYRIVEVCCPHTDALIRVEERISSIHDTYVAASDAAHGPDGDFDDMTGIRMPQAEVTPEPRSVVDVAEGETWDIPF